MIRNLKVLGLALVAVFALSAMAASAASAYEGTITSTGPFTLDGHEATVGANIFTAFGASVSCPESTATGHKTLTKEETEKGKTHELIPSGSSSFTLTFDLKQENCKAVDSAGTHKATVTLNGCDFDVTITETLVANTSYSVDYGVVCPTGKVIEIEVYPFAGSELGGIACNIKVKEQSGLTGGSGQESGAEDLTLGGKVKGIHVERSGSACATETTTGGEFDIHTILTGTNSLKETTALDLSHP